MTLLNDTTLLYKFTKPTVASWISTGGGGGTSTEGVNNPSVSWDNNAVCGTGSYLIVSHSEILQTSTTYLIYDGTGQIGTVTVAANTTLSNPFSFTVSTRFITVQDSGGTVIGSKLFSCSASKKGTLNFW